jgi:hypothetical protein
VSPLSSINRAAQSKISPARTSGAMRWRLGGATDFDDLAVRVFNAEGMAVSY